MTLYLKYRPKDFESLVGQEFVKNTLKQAIIKDNLVGAYLFCGPRGTGKTSTARIFAKTINCLNLKDGNPCLKCEICEGFNNENLIDIIEIDAASYTGVDNIREIIERAKFAPTECKYKVYIIDEVHMLSKGAFNALLKILEEPPEHLKFILATTENHKIPETILSRCQRYDFKSVKDIDIKNRLLYIAKNENIQIDEESLSFILKQANGGLRNAISLFEQLIYNGEIKFENVINSYGLPKKEIVKNFYDKLFNKDSSLIGDFDNISANFNLNLFFRELLFFIRDELLNNIDNNELVGKNIFLLENIEDAYIKAKNSFEEKTAFLVGIIKCIKDKESLTTKTKSTKPITPIIETKKVEEKKEVLETKKVEEKKEKNDDKVSFDDLIEVFSGSDDKKDKNKTSFDLDKFIGELKSFGVKSSVTMSLRGAGLNFDGKNFIIDAKTKIALNQIGASENISFMTKALENMGFFDVNISVK